MSGWAAYTAAIALLDGVVDPAAVTDARRFAPDVVALLDNTVLISHPAISGRFDRMHVDIAVDLENGTPVSHRCEAPLGSWSRPVPPERIRAKAQGLLAEVLGRDRADAVIGAVAEPSLSVCRLMDLLR